MLPFGRAVGALVVLLVVVPTGSVGAASSAPTEARVTRLRVVKGAHAMQLLRGGEVVRSYRVAIGPGGAGPKTREGDRVTPVGRYRIVARHASQFRIFLLLDYPNASDRARFTRMKERGELPRGATIGGAIGIHGPPVSLPEEDKRTLNESDWTLGCVAASDDDIREIARLVPDGTPVDIED
jgi:murein L,D-transpeptidase YafK